jgi:acetyl esterase/lipase
MGKPRRTYGHRARARTVTWRVLVVGVLAGALAFVATNHLVEGSPKPPSPHAQHTTTSATRAPVTRTTPATAAAPVPTFLHDRIYAWRGRVPLTYDIAWPDARSEPAAAVVLLHGGGWWSGSKADVTAGTSIADALRAAGFVVVAADYRLACGTSAAPRNAYGHDFTTNGALCGAYLPDELQDVRDLVAHLRGESTSLRIDPARIGMLGISAGGHLALLTAATMPDAPVRAVVNWSGAGTVQYIASQDTNPTSRHARTIRASFTNAIGCEAPACPDRWRAASPRRSLTDQTRPFAVLSIAGEHETQVPLIELEAYHRRLTELGFPNQVEAGAGLCHGSFCGTLQLPGHADTGLDESVAFLRAVLSPASR